MGQIYTKKKDDFDKDAKTMNGTEFIDRMVSSRRMPEERKKVDKIETPK